MRSVHGIVTGDGMTFSSVDKSLEEIPSLHVRIKIHTAGMKRMQATVMQSLSGTAEHRLFPACVDLCGEIVKICDDVTRFTVGDMVTGIIPLLSDQSACADFCLMHELDLVKVPPARSATEAAACIGSGVRAYTALHYLGRICAGDTVIVMSGANAEGLMVIQLATLWGAKVIATVCGDEERLYLEKLMPDIAQIIDIGAKNSSLVSIVLEETGGLGADIVIDDGVKMYSTDHEQQTTHPHKHDIISCLAVQGRWVTSQFGLQLDPPDSELLFLRSASVSFLFYQTWSVSRSQQGRYLHILTDLMEKLASGLIKANVSRTVQFADAESALVEQPERGIGATIMHMN